MKTRHRIKYRWLGKPQMVLQVLDSYSRDIYKSTVQHEYWRDAVPEDFINASN